MEVSFLGEVSLKACCYHLVWDGTSTLGARGTALCTWQSPQFDHAQV